MDVHERLTYESGVANPLLLAEHVHRYELAGELCDDRRVLDLCCGSGFGSRILSEVATEVVGIDNDVATIESANATVGDLHNASFEAADAIEYLSRDQARRFEVVVCFEGLEHLADLNAAVEGLTALANLGIKMILSVPNSRAFDEDNPFHLTEFGYEEALATYDRIGDGLILFQFLAEGSLIYRKVAGDLQSSTVLRNYADDEWANHFIGLINYSAAELPANLSSHASVALAPNANRHHRNLERANRELWRENARLGRELMSRVGDQSESRTGTAAASLQLKLETETTARRAAEARTAELEQELETVRRLALETRR